MTTPETTPAAPNPYDVFISHAHGDNDATKRIHAALSAAGLATWVDVERLKPGDLWSDGIQDALHASRAGLLLISPASIKSVPCKSEHWFFLNRLKNNEKRIFVAVLAKLEPHEFPWYLNAIQYVDLTDRFDERLADLIRAMQGKADAPTLPLLSSTQLPPDAPQTANASATLITDPDDVPFAPRRLIGRDAALTTITGWLNDPDGARGLIQAHGGAGKTALTAKALQAWLEQQPGSSALWITAGRADAAAIFAAIGQALKNPQALAAAPEDQQPNVVKALLRAAQIQAVVLDDCWNAAALGRTLKAIPTRLPVLVTSRQRQVDNMTAYIELPDLAPDDAVTMLQYHAGRTLDPADARAVCAKVGNLAFAVEIAGKLLKKRTEWSAADLLKTVDVLTQPRPETDDPETGRESVNALIEASLNALEDEEARAVFLAFGAFPGTQLTVELISIYRGLQVQREVAPHKFTDSVIARLNSTTEKALQRLFDHGLAFYVRSTNQSDPAYRIHSLSHLFASKMKNYDATLVAVIACSILSQRHSTANWENFKALLPVMEVIEGAVRQAIELGLVEIIESFVQSLCSSSGGGRGDGGILDYRGLYFLEEEILVNALNSALQRDDKVRTMFYSGNLANVRSRMGMYEEARTLYHQVAKLAHQLGDKPREWNALNGQANMASRLGDHRKALKLHERALKIAKQVNDTDAEATVLHALGNSYGRAGNHLKAIEYLLIALELTDRTNNRATGILSLNIGISYLARAEHDQALPHLEKAVELTRLIGDRNGEAASLNGLGIIALANEDLEQAEAYFLQAKEIYLEMGIPHNIASVDINLEAIEAKKPNIQ